MADRQKSGALVSALPTVRFRHQLTSGSPNLATRTAAAARSTIALASAKRRPNASVTARGSGGDPSRRSAKMRFGAPGGRGAGCPVEGQRYSATAHAASAVIPSSGGSVPPTSTARRCIRKLNHRRRGDGRRSAQGRKPTEQHPHTWPLVWVCWGESRRRAPGPPPQGRPEAPPPRPPPTARRGVTAGRPGSSAATRGRPPRRAPRATPRAAPPRARRGRCRACRAPPPRAGGWAAGGAPASRPRSAASSPVVGGPREHGGKGRGQGWPTGRHRHSPHKETTQRAGAQGG